MLEKEVNFHPKVKILERLQAWSLFQASESTQSMQQWRFYFRYFLATLMTSWAKISTGLKLIGEKCCSYYSINCFKKGFPSKQLGMDKWSQNNPDWKFRNDLCWFFFNNRHCIQLKLSHFEFYCGLFKLVVLKY